ncbi:uncharacterized protein [Rutidosis leptorrhynchoides]|uniref:uncharacterized protein n=1 Tax=Rutidosis leptorrhynchoides TaxID=125765 RepID=UPI003A9A2A45
MDFNFRRFDSQGQHNPLFPTSSLSSVSPHAFVSDLPVTEVWPIGRSVMSKIRAAIEVEITKERMRSEIIAEEIARQCLRRDMVLERDTMVPHNNEGYASSYMLGPPPFSSHHNRFEHETNMHGRLFSHEDIGRMMSSHEINGGRDASYGRDIWRSEMVLFQRGPESSMIEMIPTYQPKHEEIVSLGQPFGAPVSSLKRKLPPLPSPAGERSSELYYLDTSNKKMMDERRYALCQSSATSEQGLNDHHAGRKHKSNMEALNRGKNGGEIGLGIIKEERKTERKNKKRKLKPWCRLCQVQTTNEKCMIKHKAGKKHKQNLLKRARA